MNHFILLHKATAKITNFERIKLYDERTVNMTLLNTSLKLMNHQNQEIYARQQFQLAITQAKQKITSGFLVVLCFATQGLGDAESPISDQSNLKKYSVK